MITTLRKTVEECMMFEFSQPENRKLHAMCANKLLPELD